MSDKYHQENESEKNVAEESYGCGMFDFLKRKENEKSEKPQHDKDTGMADVQQSYGDDSSSSSSDEEGESGEKKKKKKGIKDKIKDKMSGKKEDHHEDPQHATTPAEKTCDNAHVEVTHPEEKGFIEKIKDKLPGQHKKPEDSASVECAAHGRSPEGEKKGILEKIKEKLPVGHKNEEKKHEN
ncbi:hypothetical protein FEM48_Zijuj09G0159200 [Ziziphus jujuba var. spinosa]|uniref:Phosphoprotein ECPP44-like n=1 Tax=Ziziphus jujuba var. spinosa TaxID=714518 RepID=A0A978UTX3_ZIZJJ|nr:hypothetical protein FEM48_Zijuj09G0159200 [Ziziphus jujuba var. spinosa]